MTKTAKKVASKNLVAIAAALTTALGTTAIGTSCGYGYDGYYYDYAYYDPYYYGYDTYYAYSYVDPVYDDFYTTFFAPQAGPVDLNTLASTIASKAGTYSGGCATATASGATVTFAYSNCTGPSGLGNYNGHVTLTLSQSSGGKLSLAATSSDLTVNGDSYVLDLTATGGTSGGQTVIIVTSKSYSPARFDSRESQTTLSWTKGSNCLDASGTSTSSRGGKTATATLTGYHRCDSQCPSAGTIEVTTESGTFSATFDGSNRFVVNGPSGSTKGYDMSCTAPGQ